VKRLVLIVAFASVLAGCGSGGSTQSRASYAHTVSCPVAWKAGWQRLANDVGAAVYCPSWMPRPIDAKIGGTYKNGRWVDTKDQSYLVSFVWVDNDAGISQEVHVNFRGYPGRTAIPTCESTNTANGKTVRTPVPCFSDPQPKPRVLGDIKATVYTVNQGIDEWHVLYAWRHNGSLYTVSQHVASPYSYKQVIRNLDRMTRGLVALEPNA
jgi:hypothetical protein